MLGNFWQACIDGKKDIVLELLPNVNVNETHPSLGETALYFACTYNHIEIVEKLLNAGANPNMLVLLGSTSALHVAATKGLTDIVRLLLQNGANANLKNKDKKTPLHEAALYGRADATFELLQQKAEPNSKDSMLRTPLHYAATRSVTFVKADEQDYDKTVINLLGAGADSSLEDKLGDTYSSITKKRTLDLKTLNQEEEPKRSQLLIFSMLDGLKNDSGFHLSISDILDEDAKKNESNMDKNKTKNHNVM